MFIKLAKFVLLPYVAVVYAFLYPCFILVLSTLSTAVIQVPGDHFFYPKYVTETFAKYVWLYTTLVLLVFVLITQYTLTAGQLFKVLPACVRLLLNLALTVAGKFFINYLSVVDGECSDGAYKSARECVKNEHSWMARTPPFACFLTFYAMLVLLEETKGYEEWEELEVVVRRKYELDAIYGTSFRACGSVENFVDVEKVIALYGRSTAIVKMTYCLLAVIMVLLHLVNIVIIVCNNSTPAAVVVNSLVAVLIWSITYRLIYRVQFCTFKKSVQRTKIEEYIAVAECNSEKNNVIEEILAGNDIRTNSPRWTTWLLSRMYKPYSYDSL